MDRVQRTVIGLLEPGRDERYHLPPSALARVHQEVVAALIRSDAKAEMSALLRLVAALGGRLKSPAAAGTLVRLLQQIPLAMAFITEELTLSRQQHLAAIAQATSTDQPTKSALPRPLHLPPPLPRSRPRRAWSGPDTELLEVDATRPDLVSAGAREASR